MTELVPLMVTARSAAHAEYMIRSRAEQRGIALTTVEVVEGAAGMWHVTVTVADGTDPAQAAQLGDDTQVLHFRRGK